MTAFMFESDILESILVSDGTTQFDCSLKFLHIISKTFMCNDYRFKLDLKMQNFRQCLNYWWGGFWPEPN